MSKVNNHYQRAARFLGACLLMSALYATPALATDFSGEWTFNEAESDLGDTQFQFAWQSLTISQNEEMITIERQGQGQGGTIQMTETISLTGEESENQWFGNNTRTSTASLMDDGELVIESEAEFTGQGGQTNVINSTETFHLSDDGTVLTITNEVSSSFGSYTQTLVYESP